MHEAQAVIDAVVFDLVDVSGEEGLIKPDPAIFRVLCERHGVVPASSLFIDDNPANVEASEARGFTAHRYAGATPLRTCLAGAGLL